jgi:hypothetical protein
MTTEKNLWNLTDGRTTEVLKYLKNLKPKHNFSVEEMDRFFRLKQTAMKKESNDSKLETVGYRYGKEPSIYFWAKDKR